VTATDHAVELVNTAAQAAADKLAHAIEEQLQKEHGVKPVRREGEREGRWILLDFLDIVVHVQHSEERSYYGLERLWKDCPELSLPADAVASRNRPDDEVFVREPNEFDHVEAVLQAEADRSLR